MSSTVDYSYSSDSVGTMDIRSVPSWIRLLDSPRYPAHDLATETRDSRLENNPPDDTASQPDIAGSSNLWYMSPVLDKPVTGYYNRITRSNLSLASPLDAGPLPPPPPAIVADNGGPRFGWTTTGLGMSSLRRSSHPTHSPADQGVYSELYAPWLQSKDHTFDKSLWMDGKSNGETWNKSPWLQSQSMDKFPNYLQHGVSDLHRCYSNQGFLPGEEGEGMRGSVDGVSRDGPEVLKPEEYLSGLQTETYSVQYARAPCGRCTRVVTLLLVVMGLAIVALATALTVSVLTKTDAGNESLQGGYPVVQASMLLKILNKNFSSDMADADSELFHAVAAPYSMELDRLFLASPLANVYRGNKVIALEPGSINARTELLFLDTGKVTKAEVVEDVIKSAELASQWEESDARAMGQFVVCADCVTVSLNFTRIPRLPPAPILRGKGPDSAAGTPANGTSTEQPATETGAVLFSNTTPFLSDGHFVIACDVMDAVGWSVLTLEFHADNSSTVDTTMQVLVTLRHETPSLASVAQAVASRVFAFPDTSADHVSVVVNVTGMTCADRGDYRCRLTLKDGREFSAAGRVGILELPSAPIIRETRSSSAWDGTPVYSCSAKLGYPPGALTLSLAQDARSTFERLDLIDIVLPKDCEGQSEIRVSALDLALLGNGSRLMCQVFSEHLQLIDSTKYSAFHQITLPRKLEIQTKSTSVGHGLAAVRCRLLNPPTWTRLTLLKLTSSGSKEVTSLQNDGKMVWTDYYLRHRTLTTSNVSASQAEFSIFIFSLKCSDEGLYACAVQADVNMAMAQAYLNVTAKPTRPELNVPIDVIQSDVTPSSITCKAKVGRPAGNLVLAVKHQNEADFRETNFNEQTTIPLSCTTEVRGIFHPGAGALKNGSSVSCHVVPHETLREVIDTSVVVDQFKILPDAMCTGLQEANISHPTDCRHVVYCKNDVIDTVFMCPDGFCYDATTRGCSVPIPLQPHTEPKDSPCYPDKDHVTFPHPRQCTTFIQCYKGREVPQHCRTGELYVTRRQCSDDVTMTQCYRILDTSVGVMTNVTILPSN